MKVYVIRYEESASGDYSSGVGNVYYKQTDALDFLKIAKEQELDTLRENGVLPTNMFIYETENSFEIGAYNDNIAYYIEEREVL